LVFGFAVAAGSVAMENTFASPQPRPQIICGNNHTLALDADGDVYAWGHNVYGQLGLGIKPNGNPDKDPRNTPTKIPALDNPTVIAIAAGANHSLALTSDGKVFAWGRNNARQLGLDDTLDRTTPTQVTQAQFFTSTSTNPSTIPLPKICGIAAGDDHSFAISGEWMEDGSPYQIDPEYFRWFGDPGNRYQFVFGWGHNGGGRLGINSNSTVSAPRNVNMRAASGGRIYEASAGMAHSLLAAVNYQHHLDPPEPYYAVFSTGNNSENQVSIGSNLFMWYYGWTV